MVLGAIIKAAEAEPFRWIVKYSRRYTLSNVCCSVINHRALPENMQKKKQYEMKRLLGAMQDETINIKFGGYRRADRTNARQRQTLYRQ